MCAAWPIAPDKGEPFFFPFLPPSLPAPGGLVAAGRVRCAIVAFLADVYWALFSLQSANAMRTTFACFGNWKISRRARLCSALGPAWRWERKESDLLPLRPPISLVSAGYLYIASTRHGVARERKKHRPEIRTWATRGRRCRWPCSRTARARRRRLYGRPPTLAPATPDNKRWALPRSDLTSVAVCPCLFLAVCSMLVCIAGVDLDRRMSWLARCSRPADEQLAHVGRFASWVSPFASLLPASPPENSVVSVDLSPYRLGNESWLLSSVPFLEKLYQPDKAPWIDKWAVWSSHPKPTFGPVPFRYPCSKLC